MDYCLVCYLREDGAPASGVMADARPGFSSDGLQNALWYWTGKVWSLWPRYRLWYTEDEKEFIDSLDLPIHGEWRKRA